jgi:hypothetical protein
MVALLVILAFWLGAVFPALVADRGVVRGHVFVFEAAKTIFATVFISKLVKHHAA